MPELKRHTSEKAVENAVMGTLVCMAQIPLAQWQEMSLSKEGLGPRETTVHCTFRD